MSHKLKKLEDLPPTRSKGQLAAELYPGVTIDCAIPLYLQKYLIERGLPGDAVNVCMGYSADRGVMVCGVPLPLTLDAVPHLLATVAYPDILIDQWRACGLDWPQ